MGKIDNFFEEFFEFFSPPIGKKIDGSLENLENFLLSATPKKGDGNYLGAENLGRADISQYNKNLKGYEKFFLIDGDILISKTILLNSEPNIVCFSNQKMIEELKENSHIVNELGIKNFDIELQKIMPTHNCIVMRLRKEKFSEYINENKIPDYLNDLILSILKYSLRKIDSITKNNILKIKINEKLFENENNLKVLSRLINNIENEKEIMRKIIDAKERKIYSEYIFRNGD